MRGPRWKSIPGRVRDKEREIEDIRARMDDLHEFYLRLGSLELINTKEKAKHQWSAIKLIAMVDSIETIHRVEVFEDGLTVLCFGTSMQDYDGSYKSIDQLPKWMQDKLHVLAMMDYKPPTKTVEGIGRRISRDVFWVVGE